MKTPKLYIRGVKDPKVLKVDEGKHIEDMLKDVLVDPETVIVIEGVWTGKKKDVKFVDWETEQSYGGRAETELSKDEFREIAKEIEEAEKLAVLNGFSSGYFRDFWFEMKGVIRLEYKQDWQDQKYYDRMVKDPAGYVSAQNLLEAYEKKLSKINYAKSKEMEGLELTASQM